jgi:hypothetical protein
MVAGLLLLLVVGKGVKRSSSWKRLLWDGEFLLLRGSAVMGRRGFGSLDVLCWQW